MGKLYLVATPIGNLEDITLRALRVLQSVVLIAAEDTRITRKLLTHYDIHTPLISYHAHNERARLERLLQTLRIGDVALVCDAGTPGLSDPGALLVREALTHGVTIVPIPGPSALVTALTASGISGDCFTFLGFLPRKARERQTTLQQIADVQHTLVLYEAPHRLLETLRDALTVLGDRKVTIGRELTKLHEEIWGGTISQAIERFEVEAPRGEITLVVSGASPPQKWPVEKVRAAFAERLAEGQSRSAAARAVAAESGWTRREIYALEIDSQEKISDESG